MKDTTNNMISDTTNATPKSAGGDDCNCKKVATTTKISKSAIVRTVALAFVILNLILKAMGKNPIEIEQGTILAVLELIIQVGIIVASWKCDNCFTKQKKQVGAFLEQLENSE